MSPPAALNIGSEGTPHNDPDIRPEAGPEARSDLKSDADAESETSSDKETDANSGAESDTSSVIYSHEPFATFQRRVLALAQKGIWADAAPHDITVERLAGGGYNRIIGLTRQVREKEKPDAKIQYILRIPRFYAAQVDRDVAALLFVHRYTKIPAPRVITFDESSANEIGSPYMVQDLLEGTCLHLAFPGLSHKERCRVARELGNVYCEMLLIHSNVAGKLALPSGDKSLQAALHVSPWISTGPPTSTTPYVPGRPSEPVYKTLIAAFCAWKAEELRLRPKSSFKPDIIDRFITMTEQLDEKGLLGNYDPYTLAHLDLAPRNIMVRSTRNEKLPIISGILDWDSAVLGPAFMSCAPPTWIWAWDDDDGDDSEDGRGEATDYDPPTPEGRELKHIFDAAAGPVFERFAYDPVFRLSRRLIRFIVEGLRTTEQIKEAEAMLQEWDDIRLR